jgi:hypothetical protein
VRADVTRADVEERWLALIEGRIRPDDVRAWADPWVLGTEAEPSEWGVDQAIYVLHGLTGRNGWQQLRADELEVALRRWRAMCADYDADPAGFVHQQRLDFIRGFAAHYPDKAPEVAAELVRRGQLSEDDIDSILG